LLKYQERLAQFREEICVRADNHAVRVRRGIIGLAAMQVVTADLAKENLALHAESRWRAGGAAVSSIDEPRDHLNCVVRLEVKHAAAVRRGDLSWKRIGEKICGNRVG